MSRITEIQQEIANLQAELAILSAAPEDTYNFGTVVVFAAGSGGVIKDYYRKVGEELWSRIGSSSTEKDLASIVYDYNQSSIGYFEVYVLTVANAPIYASA